MLHRATESMCPGLDTGWKYVAERMMNNLEAKTRTTCGYASVSDVNTHKLEDDMPSYLMSETFKYLYLIFDDDNFLHKSETPWIFTTEAHPLKHLPALEPAAAPAGGILSRINEAGRNRIEKEYRDDIAKTGKEQRKKLRLSPPPSSPDVILDLHAMRQTTSPVTFIPVTEADCPNYHHPALWQYHLAGTFE